MEYRKFGSTYILRIDRGEEILASITTLCNAEKIRLGSVSGIGAVGEVTLGVFNREKFAYESTTYTGDYEIASCSGTITTKEGETYLHIHMAVGNAVKDECHGGHLNRAVVSLTGEFVIQQLDGTVEREYSPEVGLNLFKHFKPKISFFEIFIFLPDSPRLFWLNVHCNSFRCPVE